MTGRLEAARRPLVALRRDFERMVAVTRRSGSRSPRLAAASDASMWVLTGLRVSAALRATVGSSLGISSALRVLFHVDAWSDDIGGGLRLPHPFGIVIGEGAHVGEDCTLMHNVTLQRGAGTSVGRGAVLGTGSVVLAGAHVGDRCVVGALSVVRDDVPDGSVAVGAPARVVRRTRLDEAA